MLKVAILMVRGEGTAPERGSRPNHAFAKIERIWSSHRTLASSPSQHLESEIH
jgi:hypothetical protein